MSEIAEDAMFNGEELQMQILNLENIVFNSDNYQLIKTIAGILKGQAGYYRNIGNFFSNFSADELTFILNMYTESTDPMHPNNQKAFTQLVLLTGLFLRSEGQTDIDDITMVRIAKDNLLFLASFETICRLLKHEPKRAAYSIMDYNWPVIGIHTLGDFKKEWESSSFTGLKKKVEQCVNLMK